MEKNDIEHAISWYSDNRELYQSLAKKVKEILDEILHDSNINYLSVECRAKTLRSFKGKIAKKTQTDSTYDPKNIKDLAGIRIISYVQSDLDSVRDLISKNFTIIESENKTANLGIEKVGYRSEHFIAKLPSNRTCLSEYEKFEGFLFEVQLRTILEHSWAEIEHDRNYKFSGELPRKIKRRFSLLSAVLEMADNEFDSISKHIDDYSNQILSKTQAGDLNISIDSISLKGLLDSKFAKVPSISNSFGEDSKNTTILIHSLNKLNITTIQQLNDIIPSDFVKKLEKHGIQQNYFGFIVDVLIIKFKQKYFEDAWDSTWTIINPNSIAFLEEYGVNMDPIIDAYELYVHEILDDWDT